MKRLLIPLPSIHFDPSEVAIPWKVLTSKNVSITFATPDGKLASCDPIMLTGAGLGLLSRFLACTDDVRSKYKDLEVSAEFKNPVTWASCKVEGFDGILLPGGHDKGVREYLESKVLQSLICGFFDADKVVAAICHGVVLVARSVHSNSGKSVLFGRKTTALLQEQEFIAYRLTCLWMGDYYLTYPVSVEAEVRACLENASTDFSPGSNPGSYRDTEDSYNTPKGRGFVVRDRNYLSARWPGDCYLFAHTLLEMIQA